MAKLVNQCMVAFQNPNGLCSTFLEIRSFGSFCGHRERVPMMWCDEHQHQLLLYPCRNSLSASILYHHFSIDINWLSPSISLRLYCLPNQKRPECCSKVPVWVLGHFEALESDLSDLHCMYDCMIRIRTIAQPEIRKEKALEKTLSFAWSLGKNSIGKLRKWKFSVFLKIKDQVIVKKYSKIRAVHLSLSSQPDPWILLSVSKKYLQWPVYYGNQFIGPKLKPVQIGQECRTSATTQRGDLLLGRFSNLISS